MTAGRMLDACQVQACYYCVSEVVRNRTFLGQPIPAWMRQLYQQLDTAVRMSRSGHEFDYEEQESDVETLISARSAAVVLGMSKRQVQRLAPDLQGEIVDGRWLFSSSVVEEYARERRHRDAGSSECA